MCRFGALTPLYFTEWRDLNEKMKRMIILIKCIIYVNLLLLKNVDQSTIGEEIYCLSWMLDLDIQLRHF